jgi:hypothetical protein
VAANDLEGGDRVFAALGTSQKRANSGTISLKEVAFAGLE